MAALSEKQIKVFEVFYDDNNTICWLIVEQDKTSDSVKIIHELLQKELK
jgi:hypothetical protein